MATCAQLINTKLPANAGEDSQSILPLLLEQQSSLSALNTLVHAGVNGFAVRQGPWKLVEAKEIPKDRQEARPEALSGLYNLDSNPAEMQNVIGQHPDIAHRLREAEQSKSIVRGKVSYHSINADHIIKQHYNQTNEEINFTLSPAK